MVFGRATSKEKQGVEGCRASDSVVGILPGESVFSRCLRMVLEALSSSCAAFLLRCKTTDLTNLEVAAI